MVTALLFVLITVAWALHDSNAAHGDRISLSIGMTSIPTPWCATRSYTDWYWLSVQAAAGLYDRRSYGDVFVFGAAALRR